MGQFASKLGKKSFFFAIESVGSTYSQQATISTRVQQCCLLSITSNVSTHRIKTRTVPLRMHLVQTTYAALTICYSYRNIAVLYVLLDNTTVITYKPTLQYYLTGHLHSANFLNYVIVRCRPLRPCIPPFYLSLLYIHVQLIYNPALGLYCSATQARRHKLSY